MDLDQEFENMQAKALSEGGSLPDYDQQYYLTEDLVER